MDQNMPNPPLPPPGPRYEFRRELLAMFGLCLVFVWLGARMDSTYGQWSEILQKIGIWGSYDQDRYSQFFAFGILCVAGLAVARILRH